MQGCYWSRKAAAWEFKSAFLQSENISTFTWCHGGRGKRGFYFHTGNEYANRRTAYMRSAEAKALKLETIEL
jgi:hypothetical protein